jgi:aspartyl-tRNA(Asn)/glutamyl-tRNA(Gln) amidotransferase subunit C
MITPDDVAKLATLARIKVSPKERTKFVQEIEAILEYIGQINSAEVSSEKGIVGRTNIMRDDGDVHESGIFTEDILAQAPNREGDYIKVKKILS